MLLFKSIWIYNKRETDFRVCKYKGRKCEYGRQPIDSIFSQNKFQYFTVWTVSDPKYAYNFPHFFTLNWLIFLYKIFNVHLVDWLQSLELIMGYLAIRHRKLDTSIPCKAPQFRFAQSNQEWWTMDEALSCLLVPVLSSVPTSVPLEQISNVP